MSERRQTARLLDSVLVSAAPALDLFAAARSAQAESFDSSPPGPVRAFRGRAAHSWPMIHHQPLIWHAPGQQTGCSRCAVPGSPSASFRPRVSSNIRACGQAAITGPIPLESALSGSLSAFWRNPALLEWPAIRRDAPARTGSIRALDGTDARFRALFAARLDVSANASWLTAPTTLSRAAAPCFRERSRTCLAI